MADLTPDEEAFFATGELPASLSVPAEPDAVVVPPVVATPAPAPSADAAAGLLQQALAEERQRFQLTQERLVALENQLKEKLNPPVAAPDETTDPLGNLIHQVRQVSAAVTAMQQKQAETEQSGNLQKQFNDFTASVKSIKDAFEKTTPDFSKAYDHIRAVRTEDLRTIGIPEADIPKALLQDEINISQAALARGKNPAEEMYNMAKRYGYAAKAATTPPTQKIADLVKGAAAAKSPQKGGTDTELTMESLADAGDGDLSKMVQDDKLWAKLVGGTTNDIFGSH